MSMNPASGMSGVTSSALYYQPSGRFSAAALAVIPMVGAMAALILGFIYAYISQYNPLIYINFLATLGYGALLGVAVGIGARIGKVRAPWLAAVFGLVVGVIGLWFAWVFWIHALAGRAESDITWVVFPWDILAVLGRLAENGVWSIKGFTPTGFVLYFFWLVEAVMIVGLAVALPWGRASGEPFCEHCEAWGVDDKEKLRFGFVGLVDELKRELESGDYKALTRLGPATAAAYSEIEVTTCEKCKNAGWLSVKNVSVSKDKKGKESTDKKDVIENLILSQAGIDAVRGLAGEMPVAAATSSMAGAGAAAFAPPPAPAGAAAPAASSWAGASAPSPPSPVAAAPAATDTAPAMSSLGATSTIPLAEMERLSAEARNLMDGGDPHEALQRYLQILAANPKHMAALKGTVAAALQTKDAQVLKDFAGAAIRSLFQYGKQWDIMDQYGKVKEIVPDFVLPVKEQGALAQMYEKERKFMEAARAYRDLGVAYPDHPQAPNALFKCGNLMWSKLGKDGPARQMFEFIKKKYPGTSFAQQADIALANLAGGSAPG